MPVFMCGAHLLYHMKPIKSKGFIGGWEYMAFPLLNRRYCGRTWFTETIGPVLISHSRPRARKIPPVRHGIRDCSVRLR